MSATRMLLVLVVGLFLSSAATRASEGEDSTGSSDRLLVAKFLYEPQPARLDVAVFKFPSAPVQPVPANYIKRLVGLPGETVVIQDGVMVGVRGSTIERITIEGGKVEIRGDTIKIDGGKVEILRQPRR
jgi:signal peptidase I